MTDRKRPEAASAGREAGPVTPGVTTQLAQLLPELAVALYKSAPRHAHPQSASAGEPLTGRQLEAVVFLAHRGKTTMSEFADGLEIGRAAASELATRLLDKGVVRRGHDPEDHRLVHISLAGPAEGYAEDLLARWSAHLEAVFARFPDIAPDTLIAFLRALIDQLDGGTTA